MYMGRKTDPTDPLLTHFSRVLKRSILKDMQNNDWGFLSLLHNVHF